MWLYDSQKFLFGDYYSHDCVRFVFLVLNITAEKMLCLILILLLGLPMAGAVFGLCLGEC